MRFLVGIFIACLWASSAFAQAGVVVNYRNSGNQATEVSPSNPLPISGSFSASLAPFQPSASGARGTPLSVTTSDSSGSLPTGAAVVVSNAGANLMYCNVNAVAATTSDQPITANDGWFVFTIPSGVTTLHCIATGGSTTANTVGGTGLPAGTGGGSGGGGSSGAVFGPTAAGSPAANPPVLIGGTVDGTSTGNVDNWKIVSGVGYVQFPSAQAVTAAQGTQGSTGSPWYVDLPSATPASSNLGQVLARPSEFNVSGNVGFGMSYSSGNNAWCGDPKGAAWLDLGAINAVAVAVGAGATGTGSQRTTVAQDTTTVAGSAPGTAGTPSANVVSVQGVASMTPILVTPSAAADPCSSGAKTNLPISFQATSSAQLIALSGTTKIYVCSLSLIASVATVFSITGGTGTNCGTPAALIGTTSASNGLSLAANGGLTYGNGGGTVAVTGAGSELCIVQSGGGNLVGNLTYVQQ